MRHSNIHELSTSGTLLDEQKWVISLTDPEAKAYSEQAIEDRLASFKHAITSSYNALLELEQSLTAHLEFLVAKKAAASKVITVSGQILLLQQAIEDLDTAAFNISDIEVGA